MLNKIFPATDKHLNEDVYVLEPEKFSSQDISFNESKIKHDDSIFPSANQTLAEDNTSIEVMNNVKD